MYITGIGRTKFGILSESLQEMAYTAMYEALRDAKVQLDSVEAIFVANFCGGPTQGQLHMNALIADMLPGERIPIIRVETACASGGAAVYTALMSLSRFKTVMVVGIEKLNVELMKATSAIAMAGDRILDQAEGLIFPASYALIAKQHMLRYGTTTDDLAIVALKNHQYANLNEFAHFYNTDFDIETIKNSPLVCDPLRLYDCSPLSDGSCALVISREKRTTRDIRVASSALYAGNLALSNNAEITSFPSVKKAANEAYRQAGAAHSDMDLFLVHDCFTIAELIAMEDLGICKPGESASLVREGRTGMGGDIPINTDGGLKADGHPIGASGVEQIFELTLQLRGEAGKRQVRDASLGLAHNVGGVGGTAAVHILSAD